MTRKRTRGGTETERKRGRKGRPNNSVSSSIKSLTMTVPRVRYVQPVIFIISQSVSQSTSVCLNRIAAASPVPTRSCIGGSLVIKITGTAIPIFIAKAKRRHWLGNGRPADYDDMSTHLPANARLTRVHSSPSL